MEIVLKTLKGMKALQQRILIPPTISMLKTAIPRLISSEKLFQNEQNDTRVDTDFTQEESDNMTVYSTKPSEPSGLSASVESTVIVSVERFFHDIADLPYQPLPEHSLEQSPCYTIIGRNNNNRLHFCRLHPEVKSVYLESIEHHCKYKDHEDRIWD
jgi:hypothetical protein